MKGEERKMAGNTVGMGAKQRRHVDAIGLRKRRKQDSREWQLVGQLKVSKLGKSGHVLFISHLVNIKKLSVYAVTVGV